MKSLHFPKVDAKQDRARQERKDARLRKRRNLKAKERRAESKVLRGVREQLVARDGNCVLTGTPLADCEGPSEMMHLGEHKRAKTRNQAPELRHTTHGSAMGCKKHHDQYDGRQGPRLTLTYMTPCGADGLLLWSRAGVDAYTFKGAQPCTAPFSVSR